MDIIHFDEKDPLDWAMMDLKSGGFWGIPDATDELTASR